MATMTQTPLIVEDGSGITGANSFVSVDDAAQFLFDRGLVKQNDIDTADGAGLLRRGLDAISSLPCLESYRLPLSAPVVIPSELVEAQIWAAYYIWSSASNDPANVAAGGAIKREKVDVIEREYTDASPKQASVTIEDMPNVANALRLMGCTSLTVKPVAMPAVAWV